MAMISRIPSRRCSWMASERTRIRITWPTGSRGGRMAGFMRRMGARIGPRSANPAIPWKNTGVLTVEFGVGTRLAKFGNPYADGTTNPWGIDWDDYGQGFVCNCVNPHLFHVIQGAHYEPWRNRESSRYAYKRIETIADHLHFLGVDNVREKLGSHEELAAGGGHAHCGTMVYLGDNWPERYRNTVFMNNIHGRRINNDTLDRNGSGYSASHLPDVMISRDPWYMGVTLRYGPGGAVYASDWSDTGECHSTRNTRKETGRIYKISHGQVSRPNLDLAGMTDVRLAELHLHRNDWWVRHARRMLQERLAEGRDVTGARQRLHQIFAENPDETRKLRALWTLHALGGLDAPFLVAQTRHASEHVRAWSVKLLCEGKNPGPAAMSRFEEMAERDPSPVVRLQLASALQRLDPDQRWIIAEHLVQGAEDAADQNLPLMLWYAIEPLIDDDPAMFVRLAGFAKIPLITEHIARRVADSGNAEALEAAVKLAHLPSAIDGLLAGFEGRRQVAMPKSWPAAYAKLGSENERAVRLALIFDDPAALRDLRELAANADAKPDSRVRAIEALTRKKPPNLAPLLLDLIEDKATRRTAVRALANYDHPRTAEVLLGRRGDFDAQTWNDAMQTLASRKTWALALLDAVKPGEISAYTARQLANLGDPRITKRVSQIFGPIRSTPGDKAKLIARYRKQLSPAALARADLHAGREIFVKSCAACHKLFGEGGDLGPDITGAQRANLDYLLENIVDPSAAVASDFQMRVIETNDGRVLTGFISAETDAALTLRSVNETVALPRSEVKTQTVSPLSIMPEGLLQTLSTDGLRNLIAYLQSPRQIQANVEKIETDLLIVGATESGWAAAIQAARGGVNSIAIVHDGEWVGGQFTEQALACVDENKGVGKVGWGVDWHPMKRSFHRSGLFRELMDRIEAHNTEKYGSPMPGRPYHGPSTFRPAEAEAIFRAMLEPYVDSGQVRLIRKRYPVKADVSGTKLEGLWFAPAGSETPDLHVRAKLTIDASDWGEAVQVSGAGFEAGPDPPSRYGEPSAPEDFPANEMNPITWAMIVVESDGETPIPLPQNYDDRNFPRVSKLSLADLKNLVWDRKVPVGSIEHWPPAGKASPRQLSVFTVRRIVDGLTSKDGKTSILLNYMNGQDYPLERLPQRVVDALEADEPGASKKNIVVMTRRQRQIIFDDAKQHALGVLYHLQNYVHQRAKDKTNSFRRFTLSDEFGTPDSLPPKPYIRESLRLKAMYVMREQDGRNRDGETKTAAKERFAHVLYPDAVFAWQFHYDFHRTGRTYLKSEGESGPWIDFHKPNRHTKFLSDRAVFPLRSLIPEKMDGLLGAQGNVGFSSIVSAAIRLHDQRIAIGQAAGAAAVVSLRHKNQPRAIPYDAARLEEVREEFCGAKSEVPLLIWPFRDLPADHPAFVAINRLAARRILPHEPRNVDFQPDEAATAEWIAKFPKPFQLVTKRLVTRGEYCRLVWNLAQKSHPAPYPALRPDDADGDGIANNDDPLPFTRNEPIVFKIEQR